MPLRLPQLRDRTPVRMAIAVKPELHAALADYARVYAQTYERTEKPETLIPAMLETFLGNDAGFKRARRALNTESSTGD